MGENPSSDQNDPRKGRARERHERRKSGSMVRPAGGGVTGQIRPLGSFKMPAISIPNPLRLLGYGVGAVVVVLLVIGLLARFKNNSNVSGDANNIIWLGPEWTYEQPADEQFTVLVQRLRDTRIGAVYAWVSLLQPNGAWTDTARLDKVKEFVGRMRANYPGVEVFGWLGIGAQDAEGNARLGDSAVQQNIADFGGRVIHDFGFDGLMLNVTPVLNGDESFLTLLRKVRVSIGEDAPLAVVVPPDWTPQVDGVPVPSQYAPGTVWDEPYKQRVAILSSQMFITAYNAGLPSADDYAAWMAYQVKSFSTAIAQLDTTTQLFIGVPTYDALPPGHDPAIENVESAVRGIKAGMLQAGDAARVVRGIGVYAEWQTSEDEWRQVRELWAQT